MNASSRPLWKTCWPSTRGHATVIKALLVAGADKSKQGSRGLTALDYLQGKGPVPANPRLTGAELAAATKLLPN